MSFKEANFQSLFTRYIQDNPPDRTCVYELKICKGTSLPFDRVADHQIENLVNAATSQGFYHKIPDMSAKNGYAAPKPFDAFYIYRAKAYLVILFYKPRKPKIAYFVNIFEWNLLRGKLQRKSVTEDIIKTVAEKEVRL